MGLMLFVLFQGFSTIDILGWIIFCAGDCPVHCRMLRSFPGFYPLDPSNTDPLCPTCGEQKCFQMLPNVPWGANAPWRRTTETIILSLLLSPLLILYTIGYFTHYVWVYLFLMLTHKTGLLCHLPQFS